MTTAVPRLLTPMTLLCALALAGCSGADEPGAVDTTSPAASAAASTASAPGSASASSGSASSEGDDVEEQSAAAAGIDLHAVAEPIATATVPAVVADDPDATMEVALLDLERDGDTVIGTFSFTVDADGAAEARWLWDYLGDQSWRPFLVDTTNLTRHDVLMSPGTYAMTSSQGLKFRPGQTMYGFASFAAPPADVTTMTVQLIEGAAPATAVELP